MQLDAGGWTPEKSKEKENLGNYQLQTIIKAMKLSQVKAVAAETKQALGPQESTTKETEKEWPLRQEENDHVGVLQKTGTLRLHFTGLRYPALSNEATAG